MCSPLLTGVSGTKTGSKILNNTPIGLGYKTISDNKLSDTISNNDLTLGLASNMLNKKKNNKE